MKFMKLENSIRTETRKFIQWKHFKEIGGSLSMHSHWDHWDSTSTPYNPLSKTASSIWIQRTLEVEVLQACTFSWETVSADNFEPLSWVCREVGVFLPAMARNVPGIGSSRLGSAMGLYSTWLSSITSEIRACYLENASPVDDGSMQDTTHSLCTLGHRISVDRDCLALSAWPTDH